MTSRPTDRAADLAAAERARLAPDARAAWRRFGPYLADRQWGTVREDYSADGACWDHLPHDEARSRAYRWGEDGLFGVCDDQGLLCLAMALWNERDPILKERLFGLGSPEGNHGETVLEEYFHTDALPSAAYLAARYHYPQSAFPYAAVVDAARRRGVTEPEPSLRETGAFDADRFFDVLVEYAKASPDELLVRISVDNRGPDAAPIHVLPTLWFRNTWSWGRSGPDYPPRPSLAARGESLGVGAPAPVSIVAAHATLGAWVLDVAPDATAPTTLVFTENESNAARLWNTGGGGRCAKDAFHDWLVAGRADAVSAERRGTKAAAHRRVVVPAGGREVVCARLSPDGAATTAFGRDFDALFELRRAECEAYQRALAGTANDDDALVARRARAGLVWTQQLYRWDVDAWLDGDPAQPPPPRSRLAGRNHDFRGLRAADVLAMPDGWEYPWFAAWDCALHAVAWARQDPAFAKAQVSTLLGYARPTGQVPGQEFTLREANPPLLPWAALAVDAIARSEGAASDDDFLAEVFFGALPELAWWSNTHDPAGDGLFGGGFLGLDNLSPFDRGRPPAGGRLEQADATAWVGFLAASLAEIASNLGARSRAFRRQAARLAARVDAVARALSTLRDPTTGLHHDRIVLPDGSSTLLPIRSIACLVPALTAGVVDVGSGARRLALLDARALAELCAFAFDEAELLGPYGLRSLSRRHAAEPADLVIAGARYRVAYRPAEMDDPHFGKNSNWRGPVWMPLNYLVVDALRRHARALPEITVAFPARGGRRVTLAAAADALAARLADLFRVDPHRAVRPGDGRSDDRVLFHEYFDGDTGRGCGASHQTGWTALVAELVRSSSV